MKQKYGLYAHAPPIIRVKKGIQPYFIDFIPMRRHCPQVLPTVRSFRVKLSSFALLKNYLVLFNKERINVHM